MASREPFGTKAAMAYTEVTSQRLKDAAQSMEHLDGRLPHCSHLVLHSKTTETLRIGTVTALQSAVSTVPPQGAASQPRASPGSPRRKQDRKQEQESKAEILWS